MSLLPGWGERLAQVADAAPAPLVARIDPLQASHELHRAHDAESATALVHLLRAADLGAIALYFETACNRAGFVLRNGQEWNDIRALALVRVQLAALCGPGHCVLAELELGDPAVVEALFEILELRTTFVFHDVKPALFAIWSLGGEPTFPALYDTQLVAACLSLGIHHKRTVRQTDGAVAEQIRSEEGLRDDRSRLLSLAGQEAHYQLDRANSDAEATLRVYAAQQADVLHCGLAAHLHTIEFPFALANARIEWNGVHVDQERRASLKLAASRAADHYAAVLRRGGIASPGSQDALIAALQAKGAAELLRKGSGFDFTDAALEAAEAGEPLIRAFRLHRRYSRLRNEEWLTGVLDGADGRIHPIHQQLGAATGRNTCSLPNLVGIGRVLRPVVTAPPARALVELDYSQVEIGVAAAEHRDRALIDAYNSGDVYSAIAQLFYAEQLNDSERALSPLDFKRARPELRERTKVFVLGVIYNLQARGIAARFGISVAAAERERTRFLDTFPVLRNRLEQSAEYGLARGYASIVTGLRRQFDRSRTADSWTRNALRNTPIQGSATVVFKRAVIRLDEAFRGTATQIVLPVHDAVLIECDAHDLEVVSERAAEVMRAELRAVYPALSPRVETNRVRPECWNKDGHADSLDRFLDDPTFTLEAVAVKAPEPERVEAPLDGGRSRYGCWKCRGREFVRLNRAASHLWYCNGCQGPYPPELIIERWTTPCESLRAPTYSEAAR